MNTNNVLFCLCLHATYMMQTSIKLAFSYIITTYRFCPRIFLFAKKKRVFGLQNFEKNQVELFPFKARTQHFLWNFNMTWFFFRMGPHNPNLYMDWKFIGTIIVRAKSCKSCIFIRFIPNTNTNKWWYHIGFIKLQQFQSTGTEALTGCNPKVTFRLWCGWGCVCEVWDRLQTWSWEIASNQLEKKIDSG